MSKTSMPRSDEGQMTLDFLFGITIFLVAFLYLVMMIPSIFLPYQNNAVDLSSVAYRTSALLAEDPGFYQSLNNSANGSDWEYNLANNPVRVGLASSKSAPNILSKDKIAALHGLSYTDTQGLLGLKNTVTYDYYLTITWINNSTQPTAPSTNMINGILPTTQNVETIQRSVLVSEGNRLLVDGSHPRAGQVSTFYVLVNQSQIKNGNITNNVTLTVLNSLGGNVFAPSIFNDSIFLDYTNGDYVIYVNNTRVNSASTNVPAGSRIDIEINGSRLLSLYSMSVKTIDIKFNTALPIFDTTWSYYYYNALNPLYWCIYDKANLNLQVWS